jgi:type IV pilus assembly protein PilW
VLVIRRASDMPVSTMVANRLYIQTSRTQGTLFISSSSCLDATNTSCIPSIFAPPLSQTRLLEAKAYYVANQSTLRADVPSLRRKSFAAVTASNSVTDEELVSGIEDVQVRFGVDTDLDLEADTYVNPGEVSPADMVVSATIWLRVRAEDRDFGYVDDNSYQYYPGMTAFTPGDNYRRIVLSKTIQLRNTRI